MPKTVTRKPRIVVRILPSLDDPKIANRQSWPLQEIVFVFLVGRAMGKGSARDMVKLCAEHEEVCRQFLPFANGIPSADAVEWMIGSMSWPNLLSVYRHTKSAIIDSLLARDVVEQEDCREDTRSWWDPSPCLANLLVETPVCSGRPLTLVMDEARYRATEQSGECAHRLIGYMDWDGRVATFDAIEPLSETVLNALDELDAESGEYLICVDADTHAVEEIRRAIERKAPKDLCERSLREDGSRTTQRHEIFRYETFNGRGVIPSGFGQFSGARQVVRLTTQTLGEGGPTRRESFYVSNGRFTAEESADILDAHLMRGDGQKRLQVPVNPEEKTLPLTLFKMNCRRWSDGRSIKWFHDNSREPAKTLRSNLLEDNNRLFSFILFLLGVNRERKELKMRPLA